MPKTVLVVEDDFDTLHPLAELLRLKGYKVVTASNAERALELAQKELPDLIISDIVLPGKSGLHFIQSIRNGPRTSQVPILVISGCASMVLVEAEASGADFCLEKPINIDLFWASIDKIFATDSEALPGHEAEAPDDTRLLAGEIDRLVDSLRKCANKLERESILKQLKGRIMEFQARNKNCA